MLSITPNFRHDFSQESQKACFTSGLETRFCHSYCWIFRPGFQTIAKAILKPLCARLRPLPLERCGESISKKMCTHSQSPKQHCLRSSCSGLCDMNSCKVLAYTANTFMLAALCGAHRQHGKCCACGGNLHIILPNTIAFNMPTWESW